MEDTELTLDQAAERIGRTRRTIERYVALGRLPTVKRDVIDRRGCPQRMAFVKAAHVDELLPRR